MFVGVVRPAIYFLQNAIALEDTLLMTDTLQFKIKYLTSECRPDPEFEEFKAVVDETPWKTMIVKGRDYPKEMGRRYRIEAS